MKSANLSVTFNVFSSVLQKEHQMLLPQTGCYQSFLSNDVEEIKNMGMKIKRGKKEYFLYTLENTLLIFLKAKMTKLYKE